MDEFELLMKGGKSGAAIIPGNAMNSELVKRMLLPLEDDKHMPPKGKKQLTEKEIALIQWWIGHGADRSARVNDVATNDTLKSFLGAAEKNAEPEADSLPLVSKPDSLAVLTLKKAGFSVNPIAVGSGLLHVSAVNMPSLGADQLKLIAPLAKNIYWLELADQNINDQMLSFVSSCLNLNRLDLKNTQVTGRISSDLVKLPALEYVNLVGTDFDDAGLNGLEGMKSLKHLYCWGSRVTNSGAVQFEKTNGTVKVDLGINKK